jgi:hypothetical protein
MQLSASTLGDSIDIEFFEEVLVGTIPDDWFDTEDNDDDDPRAVGPFLVDVPTQYDVKCGRGGDTIQHNEHFIDMCEAKAEAYQAAGKRTRGTTGKHGIVMEIINAIEAKQGRFIKQTSSKNHDGSQHWQVLSTQDAMKKTAHCIRDILRRRGRRNEQQQA